MYFSTFHSILFTFQPNTENKSVLESKVHNLSVTILLTTLHENKCEHGQLRYHVITLFILF